MDLLLIVRDNDFEEHNLLYRNEGDGSFTDITLAAGLTMDPLLTQSAVFIDYDRDGFQDIFLANDKEEIPNVLYKNNGDGTFRDVSIASGMDLDMDGMSATVGDADNDGWLDIYVTNKYPRNFSTSVFGNAFLRNNGDGTFTNIASTNCTRFNSFAWGAVFLDGENDRYLDIHVVSDLDGSDGRASSAYFENGDLLNVTSALPCEGEYNQHINFNDQILAYPNPTSSTLNIPSTTDKSIIEVYTQSGQLVCSFAGKERISLASLSKGIYLVVLKNEKNTSSVKVIVLD